MKVEFQALNGQFVLSPVYISNDGIYSYETASFSLYKLKGYFPCENSLTDKHPIYCVHMILSLDPWHCCLLKY